MKLERLLHEGPMCKYYIINNILIKPYPPSLPLTRRLSPSLLSSHGRKQGKQGSQDPTPYLDFLQVWCTNRSLQPLS